MQKNARVSRAGAFPKKPTRKHSLPLLLCTILLALALWGGCIDSAIARETDIQNGCVSCHILDSDKDIDYRLSTKLQKWARVGVPENVMVLARRAAAPGVQLDGKHPDISAKLDEGVIPTLCLDCHRSHPDQAPDLGRLLHMIKYVRHKPGVGNHFRSVYGGRCEHCHMLDADSGEMQIKSGREQGH